METKQLNRKIAIKNFFGDNKHLYEDQLGWDMQAKIDAKSLVSKKIFETNVVELALNLTFYYLDDDSFYGIQSEIVPTPVKKFFRDDYETPYIYWQCEADAHDDGEILYSFDKPEDMWDNIRINGKSLEEVIERSYILQLT